MRRDMIVWSYPIVTDIVTDWCAGVLGHDHAGLKPLTRSHCRLWQCLIADDMAAALHAHRAILQQLQSLGLRFDVARQIQDVVMDELLDVVSVRFHRSPKQVRECSQVLLRAARQVTMFQLATEMA